jgi:lysozyme
LRKNKIVFFLIFAAIAAIVTTIFLFFNGVIKFNNPSLLKYPVRGVDVSSYQGEIDWEILSKQNIQFAFIKTTEGSGFVDDYYISNYENASSTDLRIGFYHFFSYDSGGEEQAQNFIANVPKTINMLPPVVDIEFYGDKNKNLPEKDNVQKELNILLQILEQYYEKKPIIYATQKSYKLYISGSFSNYDIWIRNVFLAPKLSDGRNFTFWQYSDKIKLSGYNGEEKFIDMNVFNGTQQDFDNYDK